jgi:hypothetical protein
LSVEKSFVSCFSTVRTTIGSARRKKPPLALHVEDDARRPAAARILEAVGEVPGNRPRSRTAAEGAVLLELRHLDRGLDPAPEQLPYLVNLSARPNLAFGLEARFEQRRLPNGCLLGVGQVSEDDPGLCVDGERLVDRCHRTSSCSWIA